MNDEGRDRLQALQAALARALTRPGPTTGAPWEPSLAGMDSSEIARSAETLVRKRLSQARAALPGTARVLGEDFEVEFRAFASTHRLAGRHPSWQDAIRFSSWVGRRRREPGWLRDVLRWERCRCQWESHGICLLVFRLRHDVAGWIRALHEPSPPGAPRRDDRWFCVWRLGKRGGIRVLAASRQPPRFGLSL